jgi:hypothetical protein
VADAGLTVVVVADLAAAVVRVAAASAVVVVRVAVASAVVVARVAADLVVVAMRVVADLAAAVMVEAAADTGKFCGFPASKGSSASADEPFSLARRSKRRGCGANENY